ncbi:MAG: hypothetical protein EOP09_01475 [Proteobacteria bacterium]|nr:MAG: hypothetical protein EOP09_01475 [Pseudomonadota bacterium]
MISLLLLWLATSLTQARDAPAPRRTQVPMRVVKKPLPSAKVPVKRLVPPAASSVNRVIPKAQAPVTPQAAPIAPASITKSAPAPAEEQAIDLSTTSAESGEVSLELSSEDDFNPYLFDRSPLWMLLPVLTLLLLGLHLLPIPRRGGARKMGGADQFFSDLKQNQKVVNAELNARKKGDA